MFSLDYLNHVDRLGMFYNVFFVVLLFVFTESFASIIVCFVIRLFLLEYVDHVYMLGILYNAFFSLFEIVFT